MNRIVIITTLLLNGGWLLGCMSTEKPVVVARPPAATTPEATQSDEAKQALASGLKQLSYGNINNAVDQFEKVIAHCQQLYGNETRKIYAARHATETIFYRLMASAREEEALFVDATCSDAWYLKGYASLDLGRIENAEAYVQRAIDLAPMNSMYLSELGHILQVKGDWAGALEWFEQSEEAAQGYSPPPIKNQELTRAKRGIGYNLIELGQLDAAEQKFMECLQIDSEDSGALQELEYIAHLRAQQ